jgi:hypothetical protein
LKALICSLISSVRLLLLHRWQENRQKLPKTAKIICVGKLSSGITVDTAAATLALAEQHSCPQLKANCLEFILGTPGNLDAVLATDGYEHLESSYPSVVIDLLKSARFAEKFE